ncbi:MAG: efflux RND transporter periplasmic adaptor subunit [Thermoanaerobaculales bacterium]
MKRAMTIAALMVLVGLVACRGASDPRSTSQPPAGETWIPEQQVAEAGIVATTLAEQEIGVELTLPGRLAFDDTRVAHVFSPVTGRVVRLVAAPGQRVRKGDALAVIESLDLGSAASDLAKARADLLAARRDYQRTKELFDAHAGAERDYEAAEDRFRQAQAELERVSAKARLLGAPADGAVTQEFTLRAPIDGEVIARMANPGMEVQGQYSVGSAVELYTVGAGDRLWALADVYENDLPLVKLGAPAVVHVVSWPDRAFAGHVDWISGSLDPTSRTEKIRCTLENRDGALRPEMYATVVVTVPGRRALALPRDAVFRMGDATVVFVRTGTTPDGSVKFVLRPVVVDDEGGAGPVALLHGVSAGEEVVTAGTALVAGRLSR